jgi:hypothetical protein
MVGSKVFGVFVVTCLALIFVGCERSYHGPRVASSSETDFAFVLKAEDDADTIIDKAVEAHGGEKSFSCWRCGYLKYQTRISIAPTDVGDATIEDTFQFPGHLKRVVRKGKNGEDIVFVSVVNHGKVWTKFADGSALPSESNKSTDRTQHQFGDFCNLELLTEREAVLTKLGSELIDGKQAIGVRVESDELGTVDFHFESKTGLLLKSKKTAPDPISGRPAVMESFLSDYKEVQGVRVPMSINGSRDGKAIMNVIILEVKFAEKFEDSTFAKP